MPKQKKIIFFTKYTAEGPSSRYRCYQYARYFEQAGYQCTFEPLFPEGYVSNLYSGRPNAKITLAIAYTRRFFKVAFLSGYDIIFIQRELFPFLPLFTERLVLWNKGHTVFDFDDAVFHSYDRSSNPVVQLLLKNKIYQLMRHAGLVITGSPYLTQQLQPYNPNTVEIPTSIIFEQYRQQTTEQFGKKAGCFRIGWIGSRTTSPGIVMLKEVFLRLQQHYAIELLLVGFDRELLPQLEGVHYICHPWSEATEIPLLRTLDAGIMPMEDNDFNKGKCGFKLIQYMACGVPTVSTPMEANVKINRNGKNLHAVTEDEWFTCLEQMILNQDYFRDEVGRENMAIVRDHYSVESNTEVYVRLFEKVISGK